MQLDHLQAFSMAGIVTFFFLLFGQNFPCLPEILKEFMYVRQADRSYQDIIKTVTVNESMNTDFEVKKYEQLFPFICLSSSAYFTDESVTSTSVLDTSISLNPRKTFPV